MNILATGCTSQHVGRSPPTCVMAFDMVIKGLEELGHSVDRRPVEPPEDLGGYDVAVICLYKWPSIVSLGWYKYGALWAAARLPHMLVIDDWNWKGTSSYLGKHKYFWRDDGLQLMLNDKGMRMRDAARVGAGREINALLGRWGESVPRMLVPTFNWGEHEKLLEIHPIDRPVWWDPGPLIPRNRRHVPFVLKKREWVVASLQQMGKYVDNLELLWPVRKYYRLQAAQKGGGGRWDKVPEYEIVAAWDRCHATVSHPYSHAGSGYWRHRFLFAAQMRCVVVADLKEVEPLGSEEYQITTDMVEQMTKAELRDVAEAQAARLALWEHTREECLAELGEALCDLEQ